MKKVKYFGPRLLEKFCARWDLTNAEPVHVLCDLFSEIHCIPAGKVSDEHNLFWYREINESIRCVYGLTRFSADSNGLASADLSISLLSKAAFDAALPTDIWRSRDDGNSFRRGFQTCLNARLRPLHNFPDARRG